MILKPEVDDAQPSRNWVILTSRQNELSRSLRELILPFPLQQTFLSQFFREREKMVKERLEKRNFYIFQMMHVYTHIYIHTFVVLGISEEIKSRIS